MNTTQKIHNSLGFSRLETAEKEAIIKPLIPSKSLNIIKKFEALGFLGFSHSPIKHTAIYVITTDYSAAIDNITRGDLKRYWFGKRLLNYLGNPQLTAYGPSSQIRVPISIQGCPVCLIRLQDKTNNLQDHLPLLLQGSYGPQWPLLSFGKGQKNDQPTFFCATTNRRILQPALRRQRPAAHLGIKSKLSSYVAKQIENSGLWATSSVSTGRQATSKANPKRKLKDQKQILNNYSILGCVYVHENTPIFIGVDELKQAGMALNTSASLVKLKRSGFSKMAIYSRQKQYKLLTLLTKTHRFLPPV